MAVLHALYASLLSLQKTALWIWRMFGLSRRSFCRLSLMRSTRSWAGLQAQHAASAQCSWMIAFESDIIRHAKIVCHSSGSLPQLDAAATRTLMWCGRKAISCGCEIQPPRTLSWVLAKFLASTVEASLRKDEAIHWLAISCGVNLFCISPIIHFNWICTAQFFKNIDSPMNQFPGRCCHEPAGPRYGVFPREGHGSLGAGWREEENRHVICRSCMLCCKVKGSHRAESGRPSCEATAFWGLTTVPLLFCIGQSVFKSMKLTGIVFCRMRFDLKLRFAGWLAQSLSVWRQWQPQGELLRAKEDKWFLRFGRLEVQHVRSSLVVTRWWWLQEIASDCQVQNHFGGFSAAAQPVGQSSVESLWNHYYWVLLLLRLLWSIRDWDPLSPNTGCYAPLQSKLERRFVSAKLSVRVAEISSLTLFFQF